MLSIIIPVYNEVKTIDKVIFKIKKLSKIKKQIIIVDDGSTDGTTNRLKKLKKQYKIDNIIFCKKNKGKGHAIKLGKKKIKQKFTIIQDADLEYDPKDYLKILKVLMKNKYRVVYGSRVLNTKRYSNNNFTSNMRVFANHVLTIVSNLINSQNLTDAHTCYKAFDTKVFRKINLKENGFSFCPEVTTKVSNLKLQIFEVKISYRGRDYKSGKKISFIDGFAALWTLIKYKILQN
jgi:glycosyltransferase involved in cell wall biosynthesis